MKRTILAALAAALALSACASPNPVVSTSKNYVGSYEAGGCNSGTVVCPHAPDLDEGLGGTGSGS